MNVYTRSGRGLRWCLVPLLAVVAVVSALVGLSLLFRSMAEPPYPAWWFGWPFFGFGWVFIPLFFIAIFFAFRWIFWGGWWGQGWAGRYYDPAMDALRGRFARGEITKEHRLCQKSVRDTIAL